MKTLALLSAIVVSVVAAQAQGTVSFANINPGAGLNAPVYLFDGVTKVGAGYTAELLAGPALNALHSAATTTFLSSVPGYFNGGVVTVSNVAPGAEAWCVVQVWPTQLGSFSNAYTSFQSCGACRPFKVTLGGVGVPASVPAALVGLTSMTVGGLAVFEEPIATLHPQLSKTNTLSLVWGNYPVTGWRYSLQQSFGLNPAFWFMVPNAPELDGFSISVTVPNPNAKAYFRLVRKL